MTWFTSAIIFVSVSIVFGDEWPVVELPNLGTVAGGYRMSLKGRYFYSFEGVPYAKPPVGENRFKEPLPVAPWDGTWEAKTVYKCMQYYNKQFGIPGQDYVIGDEDCLYLNIYTPKIHPNENLDVLVYIHGGAFMYNWGGLYGPDYILDRDVVLITMNYRLGPLGFLSTENDVVPGNNGLKDQILALQFINTYVKYFGGNPKSITIMGMASGGASVHFHYLCPKSRGLFQRGISQSGTTLNPWVLAEKPLEKSKRLASILGCPSEDITIMVECLRKRPALQIVASVKDFQPWLYNPFSPFGLVIDSWSLDPVLPDHPYNLIIKKQINDVPWIVSFTSSEGLYSAADFYVDERYLKEIDMRWNELLPFILDYNYTVDSNLHDDVSQKIRHSYLKDFNVSRSSFELFVPIISDRMFVIDILKAAKLHASVTQSPVYSYYFTYRGTHSYSEVRSGSSKNFGAAQGDDTTYIFKIDAVDTTSTEHDRKMMNLMVDLVTSFVKAGKIHPVLDWPEVSKNLSDSFTCLQIDSPVNMSIGKGVVESTAFWESLPIVENEKFVKKQPAVSRNRKREDSGLLEPMGLIYRLLERIYTII